MDNISGSYSTSGEFPSVQDVIEGVQRLKEIQEYHEKLREKLKGKILIVPEYCRLKLPAGLKVCYSDKVQDILIMDEKKYSVLRDSVDNTGFKVYF